MNNKINRSLWHLAQTIAKDLFENILGQRADRLVLIQEDKSGDLGGWSEKAVVQRIYLILKKQE